MTTSWWTFCGFHHRRGGAPKTLRRVTGEKFVRGHHWAKAGSWMIIGELKRHPSGQATAPTLARASCPLQGGRGSSALMAIAVANPPLSLPKEKGVSEWFECVSKLFVLFTLRFCAMIGVRFGLFLMTHQLYILDAHACLKLHEFRVSSYRGSTG